MLNRKEVAICIKLNKKTNKKQCKECQYFNAKECQKIRMEVKWQTEKE